MKRCSGSEANIKNITSVNLHIFSLLFSSRLQVEELRHQVEEVCLARSEKTATLLINLHFTYRLEINLLFVVFLEVNLLFVYILEINLLFVYLFR